MAFANKYSLFLINLEKELLFDLDAIFKKERIIWAQKVGINWRKFGDYNTKFFHLLAKIRKSRGKILILKSDDGTDSNELKRMAVCFFKQIF